MFLIWLCEPGLWRWMDKLGELAGEWEKVGLGPKESSLQYLLLYLAL